MLPFLPDEENEKKKTKSAREENYLPARGARDSSNALWLMQGWAN